MRERLNSKNIRLLLCYTRYDDHELKWFIEGQIAQLRIGGYYVRNKRANKILWF